MQSGAPGRLGGGLHANYGTGMDLFDETTLLLIGAVAAVGVAVGSDVAQAASITTRLSADKMRR